MKAVTIASLAMLALAGGPAVAAPVVLTFNTNEIACTSTDGGLHPLPAQPTGN